MRKYWKIVIALAVILLAGAGIGYTVGKQSHGHPKHGSHPGKWQEVMFARLTETLDLTDEQKVAIQPKLQVTGRKIHEHRRRAMQECWKEIQSLFEELNEHLTPEQVEKLKESRNKLRERTGGGRPPRLGPKRPE